jgi:hypothetical protein
MTDVQLRSSKAQSDLWLILVLRQEVRTYVKKGRTHSYSNRFAIAGFTLLVAVVLACGGAAQFVRAGSRARIGGYQLSGLHIPGLGVFLSVNVCEGSVRRVSSYGIREPSTWMREDVGIIIHREYEGTDPNCPFP